MKPLIDALRFCQDGGTAMLIGRDLPSTHFSVGGEGMLFLRPPVRSGLISVKPKRVTILDAPDDIYKVVLEHQRQAVITEYDPSTGYTIIGGEG